MTFLPTLYKSLGIGRNLCHFPINFTQHSSLSAVWWVFILLWTIRYPTQIFSWISEGEVEPLKLSSSYDHVQCGIIKVTLSRHRKEWRSTMLCSSIICHSVNIPSEQNCRASILSTALFLQAHNLHVALRRVEVKTRVQVSLIGHDTSNHSYAETGNIYIHKIN